MSKAKKIIISIFAIMLLMLPILTANAETKSTVDEVSFNSGNFKFDYVIANIRRGDSFIPAKLTYLKFETDRVRINVLLRRRIFARKRYCYSWFVFISHK